MNIKCFFGRLFKKKKKRPTMNTDVNADNRASVSAEFTGGIRK
jgi:hypothetical protein